MAEGREVEVSFSILPSVLLLAVVFWLTGSCGDSGPTITIRQVQVCADSTEVPQ